MSALIAFFTRLLMGGVRLTKLIWTELLLGGPVTGFLTLVGLGIWAVAFAVGGYVTIRAAVAAVRAEP